MSYSVKSNKKKRVAPMPGAIWKTKTGPRLPNSIRCGGRQAWYDNITTQDLSHAVINGRRILQRLLLLLPVIL